MWEAFVFDGRVFVICCLRVSCIHMFMGRLPMFMGGLYTVTLPSLFVEVQVQPHTSLHPQPAASLPTT